MLGRVGWKPDFIEKSVPVMPISGWMGDNLIKKSDKMTWWKGMDIKTQDNRTVHVDTLLDVSHAACFLVLFGDMGGGVSAEGQQMNLGTVKQGEACDSDLGLGRQELGQSHHARGNPAGRD